MKEKVLFNTYTWFRVIDLSLVKIGPNMHWVNFQLLGAWFGCDDCYCWGTFWDFASWCGGLNGSNSRTSSKFWSSGVTAGCCIVAWEDRKLSGSVIVGICTDTWLDRKSTRSLDVTVGCCTVAWQIESHQKESNPSSHLC